VERIYASPEWFHLPLDSACGTGLLQPEIG